MSGNKIFENININKEIFEFVLKHGRIKLEDLYDYFYIKYNNIVNDEKGQKDVFPAIRRKVNYLIENGYLKKEGKSIYVIKFQYYPICKRMKLKDLFDRSGRVKSLYRFNELLFVGDEMAVLSDRDILAKIDEKELEITPYRRQNLKSCSYDVTLGNEFVVYDEVVYDTERKLKTKHIYLNKGDKIMVCPVWYDKSIENLKEKFGIDCVFEGGVLGLTEERVILSNKICAQYQGRSSFGRVFLQSHQTAGWIDAGFNGRIVLEIMALDRPVILKVGQRIGQLVFFELKNECLVGYNDSNNSKYINQESIIGYIPEKE